ncbi:MAG: hypothetical protein HY986_07700 [Candidatus Melainabacteria bacterium]|nr:hypothetical protein [Candidatus Melainabacteria bacterium]
MKINDSSHVLVAGLSPEAYLVKRLVSLLIPDAQLFFSAHDVTGDSSKSKYITCPLARLSFELDSENVAGGDDAFYEAVSSAFYELTEALLQIPVYGLTSTLVGSAGFGIWEVLTGVFTLLPANVSIAAESGVFWRIACDNSKRLSQLRSFISENLQFPKAAGSSLNVSEVLSELDGAISSIALYFGVLEHWRRSTSLEVSAAVSAQPLLHEERLISYASAAALHINDAIAAASQCFVDSLNLTDADEMKRANDSARSAFVAAFLHPFYVIDIN